MKKIFIISAVLFIAACTKEKTYIYDVDPVTVEKPGSDKSRVKSTQEFISIAYSDLFGTSISNTDLINLNIAYSSLGDKKLIEDMIIRNFLKKPGSKIPLQAEMIADVAKFTDETYKRLLNREPNEYEKWFMVNLINGDATITPELIYYSFLTSNEYRYY